MGQFLAFNPTAEVNGQTILSFVKGMPGYESTALKVLENFGIKDIKEDGWYPQQAWLNAFKEIANKIGTNTLRSIGTKIIESAEWPPSVNTVESALASIDIAYHMNHRVDGNVLFNPETGQMSEGIGHYHFEKVSDNEFKVTCENPYPCEFDKGLLKGAAEKFRSPSTKLEFKENVNSGCRNSGHTKCTYHVFAK